MERHIRRAARVVVLLGACTAMGAEPPRGPGGLPLATERAVVFKDGHALLVKRAEAVADAQGAVFTHEVPDSAVLGTFWAWSEQGPAVKALRSEWIDQEVDKEERGDCTDPAGILAANPGKRVVVVLENATLTGTVLPIPAASVPRPESLSASASPELSARPLVDSVGPLVALAVPDKGTVVLAGRDIRRVEGVELSLECKRRVRVTERRKRLFLDFGAAAAGRPVSVRLVYFTPGLRWVPTYRLEAGTEGKKGTLALQAELVNELEDLRGAALDLVVGVPNFRFRDVVSPLSLEGAMRDTLARAAPSLMGRQNLMSNALFTQRAGEWRGNAEEGDTATPLPDFGGPGEGAGLFIHSLAAMDLPKGSRAIVPLWQEEVATRDLYTLDMRVQRDPDSADTVQYGQAGGSMGSASPLRLARGEVWHQLELKNETKYPLTTGSVLAMKGQVPQAQELLPYTPRGGSTQVPLTVATDVRSLHEEVELERKQDALKSNGNSYALIRKKGTITLSNLRGTRTPMRIQLATGGKVNVAEGAQVKVDDFHAEDWRNSNLAAVNSHSTVEWLLTLEPGERRTLTYEVGFWR